MKQREREGEQKTIRWCVRHVDPFTGFGRDGVNQVAGIVIQVSFLASLTTSMKKVDSGCHVNMLPGINETSETTLIRRIVANESLLTLGYSENRNIVIENFEDSF